MTTQRRSDALLEPTPIAIRDGTPPDLPDLPDPFLDDHDAPAAGPAGTSAGEARTLADGTTAPVEGDWSMTLYPGPAVPPEMSVASVDDVLAALRRFEIAGPWSTIAASLVPVLPRRRPMPDASEPEISWTWPNGLVTSFGIDLGPALLFVTDALARTWEVTPEGLAERAMQNLEARLPAVLERGVLHDSTGGLPMTAFQTGDGWASALVLAPELLARVFGPEPALILAPMRDLLVALPIDADPGLAAWMLDDFASLDPNGLDVPLLVFNGSSVEPWDRKKHRRTGRRRGSH